MLNVMGSFISTELDAFENLHKELEEKDKEIERLTAESTKYESKFYDEAKENERLHSIIKEVRKYIERRDIDWGSEEHDHVLEMLDKAIKE